MTDEELRKACHKAMSDWYQERVDDRNRLVESINKIFQEESHEESEENKS